MTVALLILALAGWGLAGAFYILRRRHRCPIAMPTWAVLVNHAGLPESCRALRGAPPASYSRPAGKNAATEYKPSGNAVIYKATTPRQPQ